MPLSRSQSKTLVAVMVGLILGLSVLATVLITRGWSNDRVQDQVEQQESERRQQMPRFSPGADETPGPGEGARLDAEADTLL